MVFSVPGYVPLNYRYDENKLSVHDAVIYKFLCEAMHTTVQQQIEGMPNLYNTDGEHNTIRLTARSGFDLFNEQ